MSPINIERHEVTRTLHDRQSNLWARSEVYSDGSAARYGDGRDGEITWFAKVSGDELVGEQMLYVHQERGTEVVAGVVLSVASHCDGSVTVEIGGAS